MVAPNLMFSLTSTQHTHTFVIVSARMLTGDASHTT